MKTPNSTDKVFKDKLGDYDSGVPMHLWEGIAAKQEPQRAFGFWKSQAMGFLLLGALLVGGALAYHFISQESISNNQQLGAFSIDTSIKTENETPILNSEIAINETNENHEELTNQHSNKTIQKSAKVISSISSEVTTPLVAQSNVSESKNTPNLFLSKPPTQNSKLETQNSEISTNQVTALSNEESSKQSRSNLNTLSSISVLNQTANLQTLKLKTQNSKLITALPDPPDPCYGFNKKGIRQHRGRPKFSVDLLLAPEYANRTLSARSEDQAPYLQEREATESSRFAYSNGFRISMHTRSGFAFRTGLVYAHIGERFDYQNGSEVTTEIKENFDADGNLLSIDTITVVGTRIKTTFNRFHLIDVPAILGYEVETRRWVFGLNAGVYFNLMFKKKGDFLDPNLEPVTFSSNNGDAYPAFKNKVGMSYFGSFSANYKITDELHLIIEPQFRYYPESFTRNSYALKQNYWSVGIFTGLRYRF